MSWEPEIEELRRRQAMAREMGGAEKVARQHKAGRLTVRERIAALLDSDSFSEIGSITGTAAYDDTGALQSVMPTNFVFGRGRIDGRFVTWQATTSRCGAVLPTRASSKSRWLPSRWRTSCACRWCGWSKAVGAVAR